MSDKQKEGINIIEAIMDLLRKLLGLFTTSEKPHEYKADWNNEAWTKILVKAIEELGANLLKDIQFTDASYYGAYARSKEEKIQFWVSLISTMSRFESGHNPKVEYKENFRDSSGEYVISRGLLQLSLESVRGYGIDLKSANDLHDVEVNLRAAVVILDRWIGRDQCIGTSSLGGGRYWSVLRESSSSRAKIAKVTKELNYKKDIQEEIPSDEFIEIFSVPKHGDKDKNVGILQAAINRFGYGLKVDDDFGDLTLAALKHFQKSVGLFGTGIIPHDGGDTFKKLGLVLVKSQGEGHRAFDEALKHKGKHETDSAFQTFMNTYWALSGLPNFKGLVGSSRAWCGLFIFMTFVIAGYETPKNAFRAISWDTAGVGINWRVDGIPKQAIVRTNNKGNCTSTTGNHVTYASGDCAAKDLLKESAKFDGYGGNQGNSVKTSTYLVSTICAVRWPKEETKPKPVTKSLNCVTGSNTSESTR